MECTKCNKKFKDVKRLENHHKNVKCIHECAICLKKYVSKHTLNRHESSIICKQKYRCEACKCIYSTKYNLSVHKCSIIKTEKENIDQNNNEKNANANIEEILKNIPTNIPNDKQINIFNINNYNHSNNNNEIKHEINNEINNEINHNSKNKTMNNFLTTTPVNFANFEYKVRKDLGGLIPKLLKMDDYTEELADQYMYEEKKFKQIQNEDIIRKYDKDPLKVEGLKQFFTELQKDVENRNVVIKKSKSGKCYVYGTEWKERQLKEITKKICNKVCDTLFDTETSMNHFIRLILGSQPKRYTELKKHIHKEIMKAGKMVNEELTK